MDTCNNCARIVDGNDLTEYENDDTIMDLCTDCATAYENERDD